MLFLLGFFFIGLFHNIFLTVTTICRYLSKIVLSVYYLFFLFSYAFNLIFDISMLKVNTINLEQLVDMSQCHDIVLRRHRFST